MKKAPILMMSNIDVCALRHLASARRSPETLALHGPEAQNESCHWRLLPRGCRSGSLWSGSLEGPQDLYFAILYCTTRLYKSVYCVVLRYCSALFSYVNLDIQTVQSDALHAAEIWSNLLPHVACKLDCLGTRSLDGNSCTVAHLVLNNTLQEKSKSR